MKNKFAKRLLFALAAIVFWLGIWELFAIFIDISLILPSVEDVFSALLGLMITASFWKTVALSFLRIVIGFLTGILLGALLAILCYYSQAVKYLISPIMTIVRATPVASFIMVMWLMLGSDFVPTAITVLMVTPIIWQNLTDGFSAIDKGLLEVCSVFELSRSKRFKLLVVPTLLKFFIPGIITSAGLAWKSGIAAEIIAYTSNSIGREIFNAKNYLESAQMLAWTLVVIAISLLFELVVSVLGRRFANNGVIVK